MPRRGYRFIGPIVTEMAKGAMATPPQVDTAQEPAPTLRADAERRQITAMSCELIGLSGRADGVGLEDLRDVVGAFQRCVSETVDRHDGFVVSRLGNAALVLFGYPATHENDAEQAVRAGLELCTVVRALRSGEDLPMRCRVGIATGMAIIGDFSGDGALQDREIIGDAPNLAGRLHLSAQPDIVVIEPATRRLIGNLFDCRDLGMIDTTSGGEPLRIWQVLEDSAVANRFEALRGTALSPLVGRDEEIDVLLRRWASAKAGDGQVVLVSGEPGLSNALSEHWRSASMPCPISACAISVRPITGTVHFIRLSSSSAEQRGSRATICPRPSWRSSKCCWRAPRFRMRMWHSSPT